MNKFVFLFLFMALWFSTIAIAGESNLEKLLVAQKEVQRLDTTSTPPSGGNYSFDLMGSDGAVGHGEIETFTKRPGYTITEIHFLHAGFYTRSTIFSWEKIAQIVSKKCFELSDGDLKPARAFYIDALDKIGSNGTGKYKKVFGRVGVSIEGKFFLNKTTNLNLKVWRADYTNWKNDYCVDSKSIGKVPPSPAQLETPYVKLKDLGAVINFSQSGNEFLLKIGSNQLKFSPGKNIVLFNETEIKVSSPPFIWENSIYIPIELLTKTETFSCTATDIPTKKEWEESQSEMFFIYLSCNESPETGLYAWIW
jgi:Copper amine oxidase N-terminal domain